jgi:hypothetical protein
VTFAEAKFLTVPYGMDLYDAMEARRDATGYNGGFCLTFERPPQPAGPPADRISAKRQPPLNK